MSERAMVSARKILGYPHRMAAYLRGDPVDPVTLELGITARCNRTCTDCPNRLGRPEMELTLSQIEPLMAHLQGQTRGLIVTGGEPTLAPLFGVILEKARRSYGFEDIVVVTNGSLLDEPRVAAPLLTYASAVRISLYDWAERSLDGLLPTLDRVRRLREKVDRTGSRLEIGASVLTSAARAELLEPVAERASAAGAHWLYFHPVCFREPDNGLAARTEQQNVLARLQECRERFRGRLAIHFLADRFDNSEVAFSGYHAAHFILVVAADGKRYVATEVKYRPAFALGELGRDPVEDVAGGERIRQLIAKVSSVNYPGVGSRNRGVLYNTLIERMKPGSFPMEPAPNGGFALPHIL